MLYFTHLPSSLGWSEHLLFFHTLGEQLPHNGHMDLGRRWSPHCLIVHWCSTFIPDHHSIGKEGWGLGTRGQSQGQFGGSSIVCSNVGADGGPNGRGQKVTTHTLQSTYCMSTYHILVD